MILLAPRLLISIPALAVIRTIPDVLIFQYLQYVFVALLE